MKYLKYLLLGLLFAPQLASAAFAVSLTATTTSGTIFAYPTKVNGIDPAVMSPFFFGTSSATTTLMGPLFDLYTMAHFGSTTCSTGGLGLSSGFLQGIEYCGNDNTDTGGVQIIEDNNANGASSWGGFTLNNDLADNTLTHFAGGYLNSSKYTSTAFGQIFGNANQFTLQNTDGPMVLLASTGTSAGYITFNTGGTASSSERVRILSNGNFGISTSSPGSALSIQGNQFIAGNITSTSTTASIFPYASSTALTSGAWFGGGLTVCTGTTFLQYTATTGQFSCATPSGSFAYPWSYLVNPNSTFGTSTNATNTSEWTKGVFFSSSTVAASQFPFASTTALSVSGNSYLGTVSSGVWNGTSITTQFGGTGLSNPGSPSAGAVLEFDGSSGAQAISAGAQYTVLQSTAAGAGFTTGALHLDQSAAITGILPIANGGTGGASAPFSFNSLNTFSTTTFSTTSSFWTKGVFFSSSTVAASQFPYASSTMLTAGTIAFTNATGTSMFNQQDSALSAAFGATGTTSFTLLGQIGIATSTPMFSFTVATGSAVVLESKYFATSTKMTVDWRNCNNAGGACNQQLIQSDGSAEAIGFNNASTSGQSLRLIRCNGAVTAGTLTFVTPIKWSGNVAPTQTTTANQCDVYSFLVTNATSSNTASTTVVFGTGSTGFQ